MALRREKSQLKDLLGNQSAFDPSQSAKERHQIIQEMKGEMAFCFQGNGRPVLAMKVYGMYVYTGHWDMVIRCWDMQTGELARIFSGHEGYITSLVASNIDFPQNLLFGDKRKSTPIDIGFEFPMASVNMLILFSGSSDSTIRAWDIKSGSCLSSLTGHTGHVQELKLYPRTANEGVKQLFSSSTDGTIRVWNPSTCTCTRVINVAFSYDGRPEAVTTFDIEHKTLYASYGMVVKMWDLMSTAEEPSFTLKEHINTIWCIKVFGDVVYTGSWDCTIKAFSVSLGKLMNDFKGGHSAHIYSLAIFSSRLYSGASDGSLVQWDRRTAKLKEKFVGHTGSIECLKLDKSGRILFSGSGDNTIRMWNTKTTECLTVYSGHKGQITQIDIINELLYSASHDGTVCVWFAPSPNEEDEKFGDRERRSSSVDQPSMDYKTLRKIALKKGSTSVVINQNPIFARQN